MSGGVNLNLGPGNDTWPGAGDDPSANYGNDSVFGNAGNDFIDGDYGEDTLDGGTGNDTIIPGVDGIRDLVYGGAGNDFIDASVNGDVTIYGNEDDDDFTLSYYGNPGGLWVDGGSGNDTVFITSGAFNHTVLGDAGDDQLTSGDGDDTLNGGAGNDELDGGAGNDTLDGGAGDDLLYGGEGNDFASYQDAAGGVDANLTSGNVIGGAGTDGLTSIEGLIGSNYDDTLTGNADANTLYGGAGADILSGGGGTVDGDYLDFGAGGDSYTYLVAYDFGNQTLIGGGGSDTLTLGVGWNVKAPDTGNDWINFEREDGTIIYTQGWENVVCFAEGTRIVTPNGEDAVENLRAGDMVLAMRDGQAGFEALRWVGFMDVAVPRNAAMAAKTAPILIKAGAIAPGMPARDLRVSPDHAMEVDGHLIPAKHLVNGSSIIQEVWCKCVRYFHLELEAHGLLLSEGTWSESYLDDGNRDAFNNTAMTGLFLDFEAGRSKGQYDDQACLPVLRQGLKLDEIHGRLALRAAELAQPAKGRRWG